MIAALDLSKRKTGWCWWDSKSPRPLIGHWKLGGEYSSAGQVFCKLQQSLNDLRTIMPFERLVIEEPIHPAQLSGATNITTIKLCAGLAAHAHSFAAAFGMRFEEINVQSWRLSFLGRDSAALAKKRAKGSARDILKKLTVERARDFGLSPVCDDEADAFGLMDYVVLRDGNTPPWRTQEVLQPMVAAR